MRPLLVEGPSMGWRDERRRVERRVALPRGSGGRDRSYPHASATVVAARADAQAPEQTIPLLKT